MVPQWDAEMGNIHESDYSRNSKEKNSVMSRLGSKLSAITKWQSVGLVRDCIMKEPKKRQRPPYGKTQNLTLETIVRDVELKESDVIKCGF